VSNIFLFMNSASRQTLESERQDLRAFLSIYADINCIISGKTNARHRRGSW